MIELVVTPEFKGPNILEIGPVLENVQGTVDISWTNSKAEQIVLKQHSDRNFRLHVVDFSLMERTATALGLKFVFDLNIPESAKLALLHRKTYNWRNFCEEVGLGVTRGVLTKITADLARRGKRPRLIPIVADCILEGINPCDVDVLLRLEALVNGMA
jgi:hypothetical protein